MNGLTSLAIVLMIGGGLGLAYGGFSYTKETHTADVGALHLSVDEEQRVNIPMGVGIGALLLGGILLLAGRKR
jgi:TRAP-type C4-dicarboxylate transport system permease small subunit